MLGATLWLAATICLTVPSVALAEDSGADVEEARQRFEQAVDLADRGYYEEALLLFQALQRDRPHRLVAYNMGWCLSRLGREEEALEAFEDYLSEAEGDDAERRVAALEERERLRSALEREREEPPPAPPEPGPRRSGRLEPTWFWGTLGATAAFAAGLLVTGSLTMHYRRQWMTDWRPSDRDTGLALQGTTDVLLVLTACGAVATLVVGLLTSFEPATSTGALHAELP